MDLFLMLTTNNAAFESICGSDGEALISVISSVITIIQIAVPILLIIFGSIDLMKAVMAGKEDEIKKSQNTFVKRAIAAIIVFFVPMIVNLLIGLVPIDDVEISGQKVKVTWNMCRDYSNGKAINVKDEQIQRVTNE